MFGVVFQNDTIFEDSISENVRLGRSITDDEIKRAVSSARAKEFVEEEGRGYDNHVNIRGANLSGGQKQRILIARALAGNPDILILDDSSSALDYRTDAALRGELSRNYATATKIIIAQRVSSIMQADLILVLDEGKIIGRGKHDELMESCEIYRQISSSQLASSK
jgi:ATP-binding cassette subfamily B protein